MIRALSETGSETAFSGFCFCFSSSFAKVGTRLSGMGFLSCNRRSDQSDDYPADDTDLERLAKLCEFRGQLIAVDPGDGFLSEEPLLLCIDKIAESRINGTPSELRLG